MAYREFCSFCVKILGFWLFTSGVIESASIFSNIFQHGDFYWAMTVPHLIFVIISIPCLFNTQWVVGLLFPGDKEEEAKQTSSNAVALLWGLTGLVIVVYGIIDLVSIPAIRFVFYQMDPDPYKQLSHYNLGYSSMALATIKIVLGTAFMTGWSREGLRNLLGLAKGLDSTLAAAHQKLDGENQEEAKENTKDLKSFKD